MPPSLFLALKGLRFRLRQASVTVIGVFVGVVALIVILSVSNGFEKTLVEQILEKSGHIQVYSRTHQIDGYEAHVKSIEAIPGVAGAAPAILAQGMIENEKERTFSGANLKGIVPKLEKNVNSLADSMIKGEFRFFSKKEIILGSELAGQLKVTLDDDVNLVSPDGSVFELRVVGIFRTGVSEFDFQTMLVPIELTQAAYGFGSGSSHIFVKTHDPLEAPGLTPAIKAATGLEAASWIETNRALLNAISLEKRVMFLVILLTLIVASFGIANVLTMMVFEKYRDIGILRSLGSTRKQILAIFLIQGAVIGMTGTALGLLGGYLIGTCLQVYPITLPGSVYVSDTIPVIFRTADFATVTVLALLISVVASLFPARKAVAIEPMEAIRYYA